MTENPTPQRHTVTVAGSQTAYWEYGTPKAPPVVLVHGFRGDHHGLDLIAHGIQNARVIVPDLPGFGESTVMTATEHTLEELGGWLYSFIDAVTDQPFLLVGHSFGTLVVSAALAQGCTPTQVVLINPISAPALAGPRGILSKLALVYYQAARVLPEGIGHSILKNAGIVRIMSTTMAKTKDMHLRAWIHDQHDRYFSTFADRDSLLQMFRASISHTVHEYADCFQMPTLIIAADKDDITPLYEQLALTREIPNAQLIVVPGVGHLVHYEAPEVVSDAVNEILRIDAHR